MTIALSHGSRYQWRIGHLEVRFLSRFRALLRSQSESGGNCGSGASRVLPANDIGFAALRRQCVLPPSQILRNTCDAESSRAWAGPASSNIVPIRRLGFSWVTITTLPLSSRPILPRSPVGNGTTVESRLYQCQKPKPRLCQSSSCEKKRRNFFNLDQPWLYQQELVDTIEVLLYYYATEGVLFWNWYNNVLISRNVPW